jgi:SPP1 gp7 family putative phage head morphogenesis protein
MAETVNEKLQNDVIKHAIYTLRLSGGISNRIIALLNRVDDDLTTKILKRAPTSGEWTTKRLNALLEEIREINTSLYNATGDTLQQELIDLSQYEADFMAKRLSAALPIEMSITQPSAAVLRAAALSRPFQGRLLREWVSDLSEARFKQLRDAIRIGVVEGESIDQIVRRIRGTKALNYRDGILETGRRQAEALVRTAVNHTVSAARNELYSQNTDILKGEKWVSTLDGRTTPICQARDGIIYQIGKGPRPPAHIGCRSTMTPIVKSWKEIGINLNEAPPGTRASMSGQVPASLTFNNWLKDQPDSMQDEILGKTKGKLFRDGGLSVDRFVDNRGNTLTLAQLRIKESEAFARAGV